MSVSDLLIRIKRAVLAGRYAFSEKARTELDADNLSEQDVIESILYAPAIYKTIRSKNPASGQREYLHIIQGITLQGQAIYTKGKFVTEGG